MVSTWSLKTPSMPIRTIGRRACSNCRSQAKQTRRKRWNSVVRPPVHSVWCRLTASMPASASTAARRSGPSFIRASLVELTSRTSASTGRSAAQPVDVGVAQPQPRHQRRRRLPARRDDRRTRPLVLEVERQVVVVTALLEQVGQRRDVRREVGPVDLGDPPRLRRPTRTTPSWSSTGDTVAGQPDVALEPGRAEPEAQREGLDRVLRRMGPGAPMGERDGPFEERREPLLHAGR